MRYAQIRELDISNGEGVGVALFVQGCHFHCYNCFNPDTWNFNNGKEWTTDTQEQFLKLIDKPYIKRISILGGEPLAEENLNDIFDLIIEINRRYNISKEILYAKNKNGDILACHNNIIRIPKPNKNIWLYTGYKWEHIFGKKYHYHPETQENLLIKRLKRRQIISLCDVVVDDRYIDSQRDITLKWKGSANQRVIDIQKSLQKGEIVLWTT